MCMDNKHICLSFQFISDNFPHQHSVKCDVHFWPLYDSNQVTGIYIHKSFLRFLSFLYRPVLDRWQCGKTYEEKNTSRRIFYYFGVRSVWQWQIVQNGTEREIKFVFNLKWFIEKGFPVHSGHYYMFYRLGCRHLTLWLQLLLGR